MNRDVIRPRRILPKSQGSWDADASHEVRSGTGADRPAEVRPVPEVEGFRTRGLAQCSVLLCEPRRVQRSVRPGGMRRSSDAGSLWGNIERTREPKPKEANVRERTRRFGAIWGNVRPGKSPAGQAMRQGIPRHARRGQSSGMPHHSGGPSDRPRIRFGAAGGI